MSHKIWQFHTDWHQSLSKRKPSQSGWDHLWVEIIIPCQCNHSRSILTDICLVGIPFIKVLLVAFKLRRLGKDTSSTSQCRPKSVQTQYALLEHPVSPS